MTAKKMSFADRMGNALVDAHSMTALEMGFTGEPAQKITVASKTAPAVGIMKKETKVSIE